MNHTGALRGALKQIAFELLGDKVSGRVVLQFNQGHLKNRNASDTAKSLVREIIVPGFAAIGTPKEMLTGPIVYHIQQKNLCQIEFRLKQRIK